MSKKPLCLLCRRYDATTVSNKFHSAKYCTHCFVGLLGIRGVISQKRRRKLGALVRKVRKQYAVELNFVQELKSNMTKAYRDNSSDLETDKQD